MTKRSTPQSKTDDLAFPVRVKIAVPGDGLGLASDRMNAWLSNELGKGRYANHAAQSLGANATAIYFRSTEDAHRFVAAFPGLELADGVASPVYTAPGLERR